MFLSKSETHQVNLTTLGLDYNDGSDDNQSDIEFNNTGSAMFVFKNDTDGSLI